MSDSSYETKLRVKQAIDIVELVGSYLQLRREGRGYKALCPWHDDTRPSLQINPERQSFKCWVCDIGGDVFSFAMKMENITFPEALAMLAERAGVRLEPVRRGDGPATASPADDKQLLYRAMDWAVGRLHACLLEDPQADIARRYLADRGIDSQSIARFRLGYSPDDWGWLATRAESSPHSLAVLERAGVIGRRRNGPGYYDRFKGRVIFPIFDAQGRAIGLGGRVLPGLAPPDTAKYVNSPETPLFSKSQQLYGLNLAREALRKTDTVLVMEGYTDCILAHQFGFGTAVAVLGTALGASHIRLLRRMAERLRIVLVLDGDEAGRRRANEILELFVAESADVRVLTLPEQLDPCDYLRRFGAESFQLQVDSAADALVHARQVATEGVNLASDMHAANLALERLLSTIAKAPRLRFDTTHDDRLRVEMFLRRLALDFAVPEEQLRRRMTELRRDGARRRLQPKTTVNEKRLELAKCDPREVELMEILVQAPDLLATNADDVESLVGEELRAIVARVRHLLLAGERVDFARLLLEFDDPQAKNLLVELDERGRSKSQSDLATQWRAAVANLARRQQERSMRVQAAELKSRQFGEEEELNRLNDLLRQERRRQGISALTDEQDADAG